MKILYFVNERFLCFVNLWKILYFVDEGFLYFEDMNAIDKSHFLFLIKEALSGRTINKEFNTMIMEWLHWLEDDNILWNKQIKI